uniref:Transmembrane protein 209 n=1 Tax=Noccaea caerulescens TaxID=107243 RepID=A0A1J3DPQ1_NOCCA
MESDARRKMTSAQGSSSSPKPSKFSVYRNPALAAASTANSLRPSKSVLLFIFLLSTASAFSLISFMAGEKVLTNALTFGNISQEAAYVTVKAWQGLVTLFFIGAMMALSKGIYLHRAKFAAPEESISSSKETKHQFSLSNRQLELLGIKKKAHQGVSEFSKSRPALKPSQSLEPLVPIHQTLTASAHKSSGGGDKMNSRNGSQISPFSTPSKQMDSPSLYLVPSNSPASANRASSGQDKAVSSPWSGRRSSAKDIATEEQLEQLLADIDEKITESAGKILTPPPTVGSPSTVGGSTGASGTTRSTPLRPVRMSPGVQKFTTPPKKAEGDFPNPMSFEEAIEGFRHLGVYPQIEYWRDRLRQWCSSVLLKPLLNKVETSHIQVMQTALKLGVNVTVTQVGSDQPTNGTATTALPVDRTKGWQPSYSLDEDALLYQLRATLVQSIDASMQKLRTENQQFQQQQQQQQAALIPVMQECVDAISEHQRLQGLMKGEWVKGLLPRSSIPADYTVQRIRELAEGTCVKNYEYNGRADVRERNKKWSLEPPTDAHLLLYLFCAYLEHPKWMLHLDPSSYTGTQASRNPLFLGVLPPKERFPEKYIAVVSGVPSTLHPGACVLAVDKQSPPTFALYWDKKVQFTLQGSAALWDSMLLMCHRIKVGYGGVVRGMNLASSALDILQVVDSETDD